MCEESQRAKEELYKLFSYLLNLQSPSGHLVWELRPTDVEIEWRTGVIRDKLEGRKMVFDRTVHNKEEQYTPTY